MKIELNETEMQNVYAALILMTKSNQVDANGMKILLNLSDKFVTEPVEEEPKKQTNSK